jgi:phosphoribosylanthranilate isomerase
MEVKICGVCRPEDGRVVRDAGADYIGVILSARSPRLRSPDEAARVYLAAGGVRRVGVFVDAPADLAGALATRVALDVIQLHGRESPDTIRQLREQGEWKIWKALRPRSRSELLRDVGEYADHADGILLDGFSASAEGGAGARFPWDEIASVREQIPAGPILIIAGGLTADSVARAIELLAPAVVDVSSGVERAVGEKDAARVRAFIAAARAAEKRVAPTARPV